DLATPQQRPVPKQRQYCCEFPVRTPLPSPDMCRKAYVMIDYRAAFQIASPTSVSPAGKLQFSRQSNKNPLIPPIRVVFTAEFKRTAPRAPLVSHFRQTFRPVSASVLTTFETVFGGRGALQDISLSPT